ncbi:hypothetical protein TSUD_254050 [Trifolium subterraneum]|uniref:Uncharacterized protein n=1 Tax=Trifolium subterraneum TaxID=3900 RepID=A0A2Z6PIE9_TRISU|nr:hypothetical protein TSUD_254050 [Trifolium subterraneum]
MMEVSGGPIGVGGAARWWMAGMSSSFPLLSSPLLCFIFTKLHAPYIFTIFFDFCWFIRSLAMGSGYV